MGRTFACSDLHGMLELYHKIKEFLNEDDIVYFLGDAGDRGTNNWRTVKTILSDPQFLCIKGNHEDMLQNCMKDYIAEKDLYENLELLKMNGGGSTYNGWKRENLTDRIKWFHRIKDLPTMLTYDNKNGQKIFLSHAGFNPKEEKEPDYYDLIWDRTHFFRKLPHDTPENWIIIHGHTPIEYLVQDLRLICKEDNICDFEPPMAYWYDNNRKCDIDNGCFYTGTIVLLDLDTFEEHQFYTEI